MSERPREGRTTAEVRRAIQESPDSIRTLAARYGLNPKTVAKWRARASVEDRKSGPQNPTSTVLALEQEAIIVAFRRYSFLPLDDCLYALSSFIPGLTRSSLHRCLRRHGISRLHGGEPEAAEPGWFDVHHVAPEPGSGANHLFLAVDRASKFAFADLHAEATAASAAAFLRDLVAAAPLSVRVVVSGAGVLPVGAGGSAAAWCKACALVGLAHRPREARWSADQLARMDRTMRAAVRKRSPPGDETVLRRQLAEVVAAYNGRCRLKALGGLTPLGYLDRVAAEAAPPRRPAPRPQASADRRKARDPETTREAILQAARSRFAQDGPEGLSLSEVARIAGVNRATAYQHFETREKLIKATAEWVSDKLFRAVFGAPPGERRPVERIDVAELTDRLSSYAMENPELCRAWLLQVLSSPDPADDLFWREYAGSTARFARTDQAEPNIDAEVLSVIMLAGAFLWPVWARAQSTSKEDLRRAARRFADECLRISMHGNLRAERYPDIAERLAREAAEPRPS